MASPADHAAAAVQLLADVNEHDAPSEARVLTQAAIAHALLGLLEIQLERQADRRPEWLIDAMEQRGTAARALNEITERNAAHGS